MSLKKIIFGILTAAFSSILFLGCLTILGNRTYREAISTVVDINFRDVTSKESEILSDILYTQLPEVQYCGITYQTGEDILIKSIIEVRVDDNSPYINGELEQGFTISINQITDQNGNQIHMVIPEAGEESEELVSSAFYNKETETIIFHEQGVYYVDMSVYGENGRCTRNEIKVIVEE